MALLLTGRNRARLRESAEQIRGAAPGVELELVVADLATQDGVANSTARWWPRAKSTFG